MLSLPVDVLCLIFSQLLQTDQLECMTVCRQWYNTILHRTLFRVIHIDRQEQLNALIEIVKKDPLIGAKVDSLNLYLTLEREFDSRIFVKLFPNLRELLIFNHEDTDYDAEPVKQHETQGWLERMESIEENGCDINTYGLLQSGICERLTAISVCVPMRESGREFIRVLTNAPALKELTMKSYYMCNQDLELLHSVLPSLTSLSLVDISFDGTDLPRDIEPATLLRSFRIDYSSFNDVYEANLFTQYISRKYTHLEELKMETDIDIDLFENDEAIEMLIQHNSIVTSHLKTLGPKLKTFIIDFRLIEYKLPGGFRFYTLDVCECQLKRLELCMPLERPMLEYLSMTTQAQCLQSLSVNNIVCDDHYFHFDWLKSFTKLKELKLCFFRSFPVSLIYLLEILRNIQLEILTLSAVVVDFGDTITAFVYPSLKELTVVYSDFKQNMDVFVSHSFPNLKRLKLELCDLEETWLLFPNLDLSYLEITNRYTNKERYALVTTLGNNQRRLYTIAKKRSQTYTPDSETDISAYPYVASKPYDVSDEIPSLMVVCNSLNNFFIFNFSV